MVVNKSNFRLLVMNLDRLLETYFDLLTLNNALIWNYIATKKHKRLLYKIMNFIRLFLKAINDTSRNKVNYFPFSSLNLLIL